MTIRSKQKIIIDKPFNIVLVEPEIPPNTGNIARLCAATNTKLHLVHPLGFKITDRELKRAGLDYWHLLDIRHYDNWQEFTKACLNSNSELENRRIGESGISPVPQLSSSPVLQLSSSPVRSSYYMSTRGEKNIWNVEFNPGDFLIFGSETKGLNEDILNQNKDNVISIPMNGKTRSLNLSTAVGIVLYEAIRQVTIEKKLFDIIPVEKHNVGAG